jgi:hypothetical protein
MSQQKTSILRVAPLVAILSVAGFGLSAQAQTSSTTTMSPGGASTVGGSTGQGTATTNPNGKRPDASAGMDVRTGVDSRTSGTGVGGASTQTGAQSDGSGTLNANKKASRKGAADTEAKASAGTGGSAKRPQATTNGATSPDGSANKKTPG